MPDVPERLSDANNATKGMLFNASALRVVYEKDQRPSLDQRHAD